MRELRMENIFLNYSPCDSAIWRKQVKAEDHVCNLLGLSFFPHSNQIDEHDLSIEET
jgi:hypothetical protein